jgi:Na+-transporting methylmalonyl-CoA/oxaloacetate decarboxylase gamma subunit
MDRGVAWGFILIPLALLWVVVWGIGRVVRRVAAGFRR